MSSGQISSFAICLPRFWQAPDQRCAHLPSRMTFRREPRACPQMRASCERGTPPYPFRILHFVFSRSASCNSLLQLAVRLPDLLIPDDFNFSVINTSENLKFPRISLNQLEFKSPRINTSKNKDLKSRRINTSGNKDLKSFVFNTSEKIGVGGSLVPKTLPDNSQSTEKI